MSDLQELTVELRNRLEGAKTGRSLAILDNLHSLARERDDTGRKPSKRQSARKQRHQRA
jgi:hypothetical protein